MRGKRLAAIRHKLACLQQAVIAKQNVFEVLVDAVRCCSRRQVTNALFEAGAVWDHMLPEEYKDELVRKAIRHRIARPLMAIYRSLRSNTALAPIQQSS